MYFHPGIKPTILIRNYFVQLDPIIPAKRRGDSASDTTEIGPIDNALLVRFVEQSGCRKVTQCAKLKGPN